ncbi:LrgB family protein [Thiospirochaeta perfilievii]|uniref:LrgB family protein n=1 Tax=Thiospirochaeta perfilievii TaxID=252967 RepID=A0A5C1QGU2_9SPIO|nr:LrgB family protein [Thiospirochaeta perfilievii]QEN06299.1 LrgB family protein [Thiospirochaeta perfilievii]
MNYIFLTITFYIVFTKLQQKTKIPLLNPVLLSVAFLILFLKVTGITYEEYLTGGKFISIFLGPATVALALPLYNNWDILKKRGLVLIIGILVGSIVAITSVWFLSKLFGVNSEITLSLLPKSITTPIGMEVSKKIGGIPSLTVSVIVLTGILGNILAPILFRLFNIKDSVAIGAALGTSAHAIGTSKAIELGEVEGAISGVSIGVAGLITSLIIPLLLLIF